MLFLIYLSLWGFQTPTKPMVQASSLKFVIPLFWKNSRIRKKCRSIVRPMFCSFFSTLSFYRSISHKYMLLSTIHNLFKMSPRQKFKSYQNLDPSKILIAIFNPLLSEHVLLLYLHWILQRFVLIYTTSRFLKYLGFKQYLYKRLYNSQHFLFCIGLFFYLDFKQTDQWNFLTKNFSHKIKNFKG